LMYSAIKNSELTVEEMTRKAILIAATLAISTPVMAIYGGDEARVGTCTGVLTRIPPDRPGVPASYEITGDQTNGTCNIDSEDEARVLQACAVDSPCTVTGVVNDCEGADDPARQFFWLYLGHRGETL
jgi:hypothetical protein